MPKRRTTRVNLANRSKVLEARVLTPRIAWYRFRRTVVTMTKISLLLGAFGAAGWGIWDYGKKNFLENPKYELRSIVLTPNNALDEADLVTIGNIPLQQSIFAISLDDVEDRLRARPEVEHVSIHRELPATLRVELRVRQPYAWVQCQARGMQARTRESGYVVDREGYLYPCPARQFDQALSLPVIVIAAEESSLLEAGRPLESKFARRALKLLEIAEAAGKAERWIDSVQQDQAWSIKVWTRSGVEAIFGLDSHEQQMQNLLLSLNHASQKGLEIASINLIPERNLPVILREASSTAPMRLRPAPRSHSKP